uniref:Aminotransferase class I/classII domain-containing protein n=1 Tax=Aegilops tauschii subsp. strangulata TaxID=200361 RepID=A0A453KVC6_AEGTS
MSYNKTASITAETINPKVKIFDYEPCGEIARHAERLEQEMEKSPGSRPFPEITYCNLGNPQALGQRPITFFREVLSLCDNPALLRRDETRMLFR